TAHIIVAEARGIAGVMPIELQTAGSRIETCKPVRRVPKPNLSIVILSDSGYDSESRGSREERGYKSGDLACLLVDLIHSARAAEPNNSTLVLKHRVHSPDAQTVRITGFIPVTSKCGGTRVEPVNASLDRANPDAMFAILQQRVDSI